MLSVDCVEGGSEDVVCRYTAYVVRDRINPRSNGESSE